MIPSRIHPEATYLQNTTIEDGSSIIDTVISEINDLHQQNLYKQASELLEKHTDLLEKAEIPLNKRSEFFVVFAQTNSVLNYSPKKNVELFEKLNKFANNFLGEKVYLIAITAYFENKEYNKCAELLIHCFNLPNLSTETLQSLQYWKQSVEKALAVSLNDTKVLGIINNISYLISEKKYYDSMELIEQIDIGLYSESAQQMLLENINKHITALETEQKDSHLHSIFLNLLLNKFYLLKAEILEILKDYTGAIFTLKPAIPNPEILQAKSKLEKIIHKRQRLTQEESPKFGPSSE